MSKQSLQPDFYRSGVRDLLLCWQFLLGLFPKTLLSSQKCDRSTSKIIRSYWSSNIKWINCWKHGSLEVEKIYSVPIVTPKIRSHELSFGWCTLFSIIPPKLLLHNFMFWAILHFHAHTSKRSHIQNALNSDCRWLLF